MRHLLLLLFFFLAAAGTHAAEPPQRPFLVIDAGMHTGVIRRVDVSADGKLLASASEDKTLQLWSIPESRLLKTFRLPMSDGEGGRAYAVALSPDGRILAAGGLDADAEINGNGGYVYLFDTISGRIVQRLGPMPAIVNDLDFSADGQRLAAALDASSGVLMWQAPFKGPGAQAAYDAAVSTVEFDAAGVLYAISGDGQFSIIDPPFTPRLRIPLAGGAKADSLSISPDGTRMALGYSDRAGIDIIALPSLEIIHSVDTSFVTRGNLSFVAWSGDSKTLFASGSYFINDPDPFLIFAFPDGGRGAAQLVGSTMGNVMDIDMMPGLGAAYSTALPSLGVLGGGGFFQGAVTANMTAKLGQDFQMAPDATQVWFGLDAGAVDPWLFDAKRLTFRATAKAPDGFVGPDTSSLPLTGWEDQPAPMLGSLALDMQTGDTAHAAAIVPGGKAIVLGTNWDLYTVAAKGGILASARTYGTCWGVNISADGEIVIAAFSDGTLRWYRRTGMVELLALFVHVPSKRWIAWTPSGYYAASPGAEDLIGWHVNGKTWNDTPAFYPASRFRDRFYRPDVVQLVLGTKDEQAAIAQADQHAGRKQQTESVAELLPASVELTGATRDVIATAPEITITYRLASPTGREISRVEARIDGRPSASRGVSQDTQAFPVGEDLSITLSIPPRDSEITLIAYIGDQPGVATTVPVKWQGAMAERKKANLHALLIGVSDYANPQMRLNYAAKDAADLGEKLKTQQGLFYERVNIVTMLDGEAGKSAIEKQLALLKKRATPEDTVLVFFAGHGLTSAALDFYYLAADSEMDADLLEATAVDGRLIRKILGSLPGRVVLMMDTCRSGAGIEGTVDMTRAANDMAQDTAGIVMFASSQGREDSLERADWENGAFTEALLSILDDAKVYGDDGRLSIPELEEAVTVRVAQLTEGRQNAGMTKYGASPRFFIAGMK